MAYNPLTGEDDGSDPYGGQSGIDPTTGFPYGYVPGNYSTANPYTGPNTFYHAPLPPGYSQNPDGTENTPFGIAGSPAGQHNDTLGASSAPPPINTVPIPDDTPYTTTPYGGAAPGVFGGMPTTTPFSFSPFAGSTPFPQFQPPNPNSIYSDPSYQFREQEGQKALESSAAARGVLGAGMTLKDIVGYGQNFASQEYQNIFNRALATNQQQFGEWQGNDQATYRNWSGNRDLALQLHQTSVDDALRNFSAGKDIYGAEWNQFLNAQNEWDTNQRNTQDQYNAAQATNIANAKYRNDYNARIGLGV